MGSLEASWRKGWKKAQSSEQTLISQPLQPRSNIVIPCCLPYTHTHDFCTIFHLKQISVPKTKFKKHCLIPYFYLFMFYAQQETRPYFKDLLANTEGFFFQYKYDMELMRVSGK